MMAEKLSDLERWLQQMQGEGERESSGKFTIDAGSRLDRYRTTLQLNPSLPWLQLTQWAHQEKADSIELRVTRNGVEWSARGLNSDGHWPDRLVQVGGEDTLMLLLHALQPKGVHFAWTDRTTSWDWNWPGPAAIEQRAVRSTREGELVVRVQIKLTPLRRRDLIAEFTARTHFAPIPIKVDGRPHPSRLDLTSAQSRSFGVAADLVALNSQSEADYFAAVPPGWHQPRLVLVNASLAHTLPKGDPYKIACYHLHHPDLSTRLTPKDELNIDLGTQVALKYSTAFLAPGRRWVTGTLWGIPMQSQVVRPLRASSVYLLSANPDKGTVHIIPVRQGVSLNPISLPGSRSGSTTICICPPQLRTDLSGLRLVEDPACRDWLQGMVEASRRCL